MPTDDAKDVLDVGGEDDQSIGATQQAQSNKGVADPAEILRGAEEMVDGGTNLQRWIKKPNVIFHVTKFY